MTNKCNQRRIRSLFYKCMPLIGFSKRGRATPEYVNSHYFETTICNCSLLSSVSTDTPGSTTVRYRFYKRCHFKKTHINLYQFQEIIFNVVQQVMVSPGSRKRQGQKPSREQCVSFPALGIKTVANKKNAKLGPLSEYLFPSSFHIIH